MTEVRAKCPVSLYFVQRFGGGGAVFTPGQNECTSYNEEDNCKVKADSVLYKVQHNLRLGVKQIPTRAAKEVAIWDSFPTHLVTPHLKRAHRIKRR